MQQYLKYVVAFIVIAGLVYVGLAALTTPTPEVFALTAAAIMAAAFERLPWLKDEFDKLDSDGKRAAMMVLLLLLVGAAFGLSCASVLALFECSSAGAASALVTLLLAVGVNQGVFMLIHKKA